MTSNHVWWKHGVIYQVYPRSFQDSDGDGIGDLQGLIDRLDYLVELGVDAVWLSPIYRSPMADFGYDISNHTAIDPLFGDLNTFDHLLRTAHRKGLRVVMDFVPNHTSSDHLWFVESRKNLTNPRRDWYIWRDPARDGGPPNNWLSEFGGPAWTFDPATGQYYYHAFLASQPDLNWRNPDAAQAMLNILGFWLARGVDGLRVDAVHHLFEAAALTDNPPNPSAGVGASPADALLREHTVDQPETHQAIAAMRARTDEFEDRVLIGEAYLPLDRLMAYYGADGGGFHLPFNFHLLTTPWRAPAIAALIAAYEAGLPGDGWPNWVLGNHDRPRLASRVGPAQTAVAAMLLLTLRGTPTLYQGDEVGLVDVPMPTERVRDPFELNVPGRGLGRDPVRTPMPWTTAENAGFSRQEPWLPLNGDWRTRNVESQTADPGSLLNLYKALLRLRRHQPALHRGDYTTAHVTDAVLAFERSYEGDTFLVALNFTDGVQPFPAPTGQLVMSTSRIDSATVSDLKSLRANEGVVLKLR